MPAPPTPGLTPKDRGPRPPAEPEIKRVVFCSGKVFYDLHDAREKQGKVRVKGRGGGGAQGRRAGGKRDHREAGG